MAEGCAPISGNERVPTVGPRGPPWRGNPVEGYDSMDFVPQGGTLCSTKHFNRPWKKKRSYMLVSHPPEAYLQVITLFIGALISKSTFFHPRPRLDRPNYCIDPHL